MTEEQRLEQITEARQFYFASPVLLPLLERMHRIALERLISSYREGNKDATNLIAELSVIDQLKREVTQKELTYRTMEEKNGKR